MAARSHTLYLNDTVYISTLTDLATDMLKIDVSPGQYRFKFFSDGYVFAKDAYVPVINDLEYVFATRLRDRGLSGTYYHGESRDVDHLRIFNTWIRHYLDEKKLINLCELADDEEEEWDTEESEEDLKEDSKEAICSKIASASQATDIKGIYNKENIVKQESSEGQKSTEQKQSIEVSKSKEIANIGQVNSIEELSPAELVQCIEQDKSTDMVKSTELGKSTESAISPNDKHGEYLSDSYEYYFSPYTAEYKNHPNPPHKRPFKYLQVYHNIPVLFYLNSKPSDLSKITLEFEDKLSNNDVIWSVKDGVDVIGYAVKNKFHNMRGDQAGIGIMSCARAFGNFAIEYFEEPDQYDCRFKPCHCEVRYPIEPKKVRM